MLPLDKQRALERIIAFGGSVQIGVERRRTGMFSGYYAASNSATGMVAYGKSENHALIRLVKMHSMQIDLLKKRLKEED